MSDKAEFKRGYETATEELATGAVSPQDLLDQAKGDLEPNGFTQGWVTACKEALENPPLKKPADPILKEGKYTGEDYTLRDKIAVAAMQAILAANAPYDSTAKWSYEMADAMLKAREL